MCVAVLALQHFHGVPLALAHNRDEYRARPTAPLAPWKDVPGVVGGRDLAAGGGWLAAHEDGRFAFVTNVRDLSRPRDAGQSRGELVRDFLAGGDDPATFVGRVAGVAARYNPFNLVVGVAGPAPVAFALSGDDRVVRRLGAGLHAFSNGPLDDDWPKMRRLRDAVRALPRDLRGAVLVEALLDLLGDRRVPPDVELPATGLPLPLERALGAVFVDLPDYGTRASTALVATAGRLVIEELVPRAGAPRGAAISTRMSFEIAALEPRTARDP